MRFSTGVFLLFMALGLATFFLGLFLVEDVFYDNVPQVAARTPSPEDLPLPTRALEAMQQARKSLQTRCFVVDRPNEAAGRYCVEYAAF